MKTFYLFLIFVVNFSSGFCQSRFAKIIDFENRPQGAKEIVKYKNNFFIHQTGICIDDDGNLLEVCSGVILIDEEANILDSVLIRRFSTGNESLVIDSAHNQLYFVGEEDVKNDYANAFTVNQINIEDLSIENSYTLHDGRAEKRKYFQLVATLFNNKLIVGGNSNELNNQSIDGLIFLIDKNKIDTFWAINFALGNSLGSSFVDVNNQLTLSVLTQENALNEKAHILKYDKDLKIKWHWTSELTKSTQIPYICELNSGNIVVALADKTFNNAVKLQCVRLDKSIAWEFKFWDHNTKTARNVYSLKKLKNGDFIGTGTYGNTSINVSSRILRVPYIFRMTSDGKLLWEKAFYRDRPVLDFCEGGFQDVEENENGELIAVGDLRNYLEYDPIVMQGRSDPDIFIVRMDANGCIDDQCEMLTKVLPDSTSNTQNPKPTYTEALLHPNPSDGNLELLNNDAVSSVNFFSSQGVVIKSIHNPGKDIEVPDAPSGMYIAHILLKSGKMIKQKIVVH